MIFYFSVVLKCVQEVDVYLLLYVMVICVKDDFYGVEYIKYVIIFL